MSAYDLPAADALASKWGRLAISIPGWCDPDIPLGFEFPACWDADKAQTVPDADHWAWEGWLRKMLGSEQDSLMFVTANDGLVHWYNGYSWDSPALPMGRACIAVAAAYGRWPGAGK